ncbi:MAG: radical SAM protein [Wolinella sp.]
MSLVIKKVSTKNIIVKSNLIPEGFSANPYIGCTHACKYCYASYMKNFTNHDESWGEFIDIKLWESIPNKHRYTGKEIVIGTATDPYLPQEAIYKRTLKLLEELKATKAKIILITKSTLILRDIEPIGNIPNIQILFSINSLDENFQNKIDRAPKVHERLEVMREFHDRGIKTLCLIAPVFPKITQPFEIIDAIKDRCSGILIDKLKLRGESRDRILEFIRCEYPQHFALYCDIFLRNIDTFWESLARDLLNFSHTKDFPLEIEIQYKKREKPLKKELNLFDFISQRH